MNLRFWRIVPLVAAALQLAGLVAAGKGKDDPLQRTIPVPADQQIPIIDFFRPPVFAAPVLNPAGTHFAALVSTDADRRDLAIFELASQKIERLTGGADHDIGSFGWLDDRRLLFSISRDKLYAVGLFTADLGKLSRAYPIEMRNVVVPIGFPRAEPRHAIVWIRHSAMSGGGDGGVLKIDTDRRVDNRGDMNVVRLGVDSGIRAKIVRRYPSPPTGQPVAYLADCDGELAFAITTQDGRNTLFRLVQGTWESCPVDLDAIHVLTRGDKSDELLVLGPRQENRPRAVHRLNPITGELGETLFQDDEYDFADARFYRHPLDGRVLGVQFDRKRPDTIWIDAGYESLQASLHDLFPDQIVHILGSDRAEERFFFSVQSAVNPPAYYRFDRNARSVHPVTRTAPWIDAGRMQPMRLMTYQARDGRSIEGYVTLPAAAAKESPAPLVVLPHGGPWARDTWCWHPEVQFLASRGYAIFQPNYRGSDGTAWRFPSEDLWDFRKMHNDVTDGVRTLLRTGLVDGDRIAIMGASFGGYLALCGAAFEPDRYRCAITIAGVFDWEQVMKDDRRSEYRRSFYGVLRRNLGDPRRDSAALEDISPLHAVDRIKIPVFVAHGAEDQVASVGQSKRLIAALKKHGVTFEAQIEREEGHGFGHLENQLELYGQLERFLASHLAVRQTGTVR